MRHQSRFKLGHYADPRDAGGPAQESKSSRSVNPSRFCQLGPSNLMIARVPRAFGAGGRPEASHGPGERRPAGAGAC